MADNTIIGNVHKETTDDKVTVKVSSEQNICGDLTDLSRCNLLVSELVDCDNKVTANEGDLAKQTAGQGEIAMQTAEKEPAIQTAGQGEIIMQTAKGEIAMHSVGQGEIAMQTSERGEKAEQTAGLVEIAMQTSGTVGIFISQSAVTSDSAGGRIPVYQSSMLNTSGSEYMSSSPHWAGAISSSDIHNYQSSAADKVQLPPIGALLSAVSKSKSCQGQRQISYPQSSMPGFPDVSQSSAVMSVAPEYYSNVSVVVSQLPGALVSSHGASTPGVISQLAHTNIVSSSCVKNSSSIASDGQSILENVTAISNIVSDTNTTLSDVYPLKTSERTYHQMTNSVCTLPPPHSVITENPMNPAVDLVMVPVSAQYERMGSVTAPIDAQCGTANSVPAQITAYYKSPGSTLTPIATHYSTPESAILPVSNITHSGTIGYQMHCPNQQNLPLVNFGQYTSPDMQCNMMSGMPPIILQPGGKWVQTALLPFSDSLNLLCKIPQNENQTWPPSTGSNQTFGSYILQQDGWRSSLKQVDVDTTNCQNSGVQGIMANSNQQYSLQALTAPPPTTCSVPEGTEIDLTTDTVEQVSGAADFHVMEVHCEQANDGPADASTNSDEADDGNTLSNTEQVSSVEKLTKPNEACVVCPVNQSSSKDVTVCIDLTGVTESETISLTNAMHDPELTRETPVKLPCDLPHGKISDMQIQASQMLSKTTPLTHEKCSSIERTDQVQFAEDDCYLNTQCAGVNRQHSEETMILSDSGIQPGRDELRTACQGFQDIGMSEDQEVIHVVHEEEEVGVVNGADVCCNENGCNGCDLTVEREADVEEAWDTTIEYEEEESPDIIVVENADTSADPKVMSDVPEPESRYTYVVESRVESISHKITAPLSLHPDDSLRETTAPYEAVSSGDNVHEGGEDLQEDPQVVSTPASPDLIVIESDSDYVIDLDEPTSSETLPKYQAAKKPATIVVLNPELQKQNKYLRQTSQQNKPISARSKLAAQNMEGKVSSTARPVTPMNQVLLRPSKLLRDSGQVAGIGGVNTTGWAPSYRAFSELSSMPARCTNHVGIIRPVLTKTQTTIVKTKSVWQVPVLGGCMTSSGRFTNPRAVSSQTRDPMCTGPRPTQAIISLTTTSVVMKPVIQTYTAVSSANVTPLSLSIVTTKGKTIPVLNQTIISPAITLAKAKPIITQQLGNIPKSVPVTVANRSLLQIPFRPTVQMTGPITSRSTVLMSQKPIHLYKPAVQILSEPTVQMPNVCTVMMPDRPKIQKTNDAIQSQSLLSDVDIIEVIDCDAPQVTGNPGVEINNNDGQYKSAVFGLSNCSARYEMEKSYIHAESGQSTASQILSPDATSTPYSKDGVSNPATDTEIDSYLLNFASSDGAPQFASKAKCIDLDATIMYENIKQDRQKEDKVTDKEKKAISSKMLTQAEHFDTPASPIHSVADSNIASPHTVVNISSPDKMESVSKDLLLPSLYVLPTTEMRKKIQITNRSTTDEVESQSTEYWQLHLMKTALDPDIVTRSSVPPESPATSKLNAEGTPLASEEKTSEISPIKSNQQLTTSADTKKQLSSVPGEGKSNEKSEKPKTKSQRKNDEVGLNYPFQCSRCRAYLPLESSVCCCGSLPNTPRRILNKGRCLFGSDDKDIDPTRLDSGDEDLDNSCLYCSSKDPGKTRSGLICPLCGDIVEGISDREDPEATLDATEGPDDEPTTPGAKDSRTEIHGLSQLEEYKVPGCRIRNKTKEMAEIDEEVQVWEDIVTERQAKSKQKASEAKKKSQSCSGFDIGPDDIAELNLRNKVVQRGLPTKHAKSDPKSKKRLRGRPKNQKVDSAEITKTCGRNAKHLNERTGTKGDCRQPSIYHNTPLSYRDVSNDVASPSGESIQDMDSNSSKADDLSDDESQFVNREKVELESPVSPDINIKQSRSATHGDALSSDEIQNILRNHPGVTKTMTIPLKRVKMSLCAKARIRNSNKNRPGGYGTQQLRSLLQDTMVYLGPNHKYQSPARCTGCKREFRNNEILQKHVRHYAGCRRNIRMLENGLTLSPISSSTIAARNLVHKSRSVLRMVKSRLKLNDPDAAMHGQKLSPKPEKKITSSSISTAAVSPAPVNRKYNTRSRMSGNGRFTSCTVDSCRESGVSSSSSSDGSNSSSSPSSNSDKGPHLREQKQRSCKQKRADIVMLLRKTEEYNARQAKSSSYENYSFAGWVQGGNDEKQVKSSGRATRLSLRRKSSKTETHSVASEKSNKSPAQSANQKSAGVGTGVKKSHQAVSKNSVPKLVIKTDSANQKSPKVANNGKKCAKAVPKVIIRTESSGKKTVSVSQSGAAKKTENAKKTSGQKKSPNKINTSGGAKRTDARNSKSNGRNSPTGLKNNGGKLIDGRNTRTSPSKTIKDSKKKSPNHGKSVNTKKPKDTCKSTSKEDKKSGTQTVETKRSHKRKLAETSPDKTAKKSKTIKESNKSMKRAASDDLQVSKKKRKTAEAALVDEIAAGIDAALEQDSSNDSLNLDQSLEIDMSSDSIGYVKSVDSGSFSEGGQTPPNIGSPDIYKALDDLQKMNKVLQKKETENLSNEKKDVKASSGKSDVNSVSKDQFSANVNLGGKLNFYDLDTTDGDGVDPNQKAMDIVARLQLQRSSTNKKKQESCSSLGQEEKIEENVSKCDQVLAAKDVVTDEAKKPEAFGSAKMIPPPTMTARSVQQMDRGHAVTQRATIRSKYFDWDDPKNSQSLQRDRTMPNVTFQMVPGRKPIIKSGVPGCNYVAKSEDVLEFEADTDVPMEDPQKHARDINNNTKKPPKKKTKKRDVYDKTYFCATCDRSFASEVKLRYHSVSNMHLKLVKLQRDTIDRYLQEQRKLSQKDDSQPGDSNNEMVHSTTDGYPRRPDLRPRYHQPSYYDYPDSYHRGWIPEHYRAPYRHSDDTLDDVGREWDEMMGYTSRPYDMRAHMYYGPPPGMWPDRRMMPESHSRSSNDSDGRYHGRSYHGRSFQGNRNLQNVQEHSQRSHSVTSATADASHSKQNEPDSNWDISNLLNAQSSLVFDAMDIDLPDELLNYDASAAPSSGYNQQMQSLSNRDHTNVSSMSGGNDIWQTNGSSRTRDLTQDEILDTSSSTQLYNMVTRSLDTGVEDSLDQSALCYTDLDSNNRGDKTSVSTKFSREHSGSNTDAVSRYFGMPQSANSQTSVIGFEDENLCPPYSGRDAGDSVGNLLMGTPSLIQHTPYATTDHTTSLRQKAALQQTSHVDNPSNSASINSQGEDISSTAASGSGDHVDIAGH